MDDPPMTDDEHRGTAGVVLAAGEGRRFGGRIKQLHDVGGRPMLERVLAVMASAGLGDLVVVLGANSDAVLEAVDLQSARPVVSPRWADGQAASLADALAGAGGAPGPGGGGGGAAPRGGAGGGGGPPRRAGRPRPRAG